MWAVVAFDGITGNPFGSNAVWLGERDDSNNAAQHISNFNTSNTYYFVNESEDRLDSINNTSFTAAVDASTTLSYLVFDIADEPPDDWDTDLEYERGVIVFYNSKVWINNDNDNEGNTPGAVNSGWIDLTDTGGDVGVVYSTGTAFPADSSNGDLFEFNDSASSITAKDYDGTTDLTTASRGDLFKFNGTNWIKQSEDTDTDTTNPAYSTGTAFPGSPATDDLFEFNADASSITAKDFNGSDDITTAVRGDVFKYDGTDWVKQSSHTVDTTGPKYTTGTAFPGTPATNDVFEFNDSASGITAKDFDGSTDLTTAERADVFKYDGTDWIKQSEDTNVDITGKADIDLQNIDSSLTDAEQDTVKERIGVVGRGVTDVSSTHQPPTPTEENAGLYFDSSIPRLWMTHVTPIAGTPATATSTAVSITGDFLGVHLVHPSSPSVGEYYYNNHSGQHDWWEYITDPTYGNVWAVVSFDGITGNPFGVSAVWLGERDDSDDAAAHISNYNSGNTYYFINESEDRLDTIDNIAYSAGVNATTVFSYLVFDIADEPPDDWDTNLEYERGVIVFYNSKVWINNDNDNEGNTPGAVNSGWIDLTDTGGDVGVVYSTGTAFPADSSNGDLFEFNDSASSITAKDYDGTTDLTTAARGDLFKYNGTNWVKQSEDTDTDTVNPEYSTGTAFPGSPATDDLFEFNADSAS